MTPDMKKSRKFVDAAVKAHGGRVLEIRDEGLSHELVFEAAGRTFALTFKCRDGRHLLHHDQDRKIDIYQLLYGYRGDMDDIEAMVAWLNQAPGLGDFDGFFPKMLREYLKMLDSAADRG